MSKEKSVFQTLSEIDVKQFVKSIGNGQDFIPWSICVREVSKIYPGFTWEFTQFDGLPYLPTPTGFYVECSVTINNLTRKQMRPVYTFGNKANMEPQAGDVDKAQQRALAKAIALHGFGLELWAGEDFETVEIKLEAAEDKQVREIEEYAAWKKIAVTEYESLDSPKAVQQRCTSHIRRATKMNDNKFIKEISELRDKKINELMEETNND